MSFCSPNSMTFGGPTDFAIEVYHEPSGPNYGGFGRMCIHVQGTQIGDIRENHCSLWGSTNRFRELLDHIETLWSDDFTGLSDIEIFGVLDRALYQDHGQSLEQMNADLERLGRYDFLTNTGEQFDGSKTFR
jgi:hypothetical protein